MSKTHKLLAVGAAALTVPLIAFGDVSRLDAVTVNATRVDKSVDDIPAAVGVVGQDEMQLATQQLALDESLRAIPGMFFLNPYNFAQDLRVSIRGFGARSNFGIRGVRIIVDGIPETLPDGQGSVDGIDLGSAGQISVIRGPTSSLYGNASGGAIIVETEKGPPDPFAAVRAAWGDFDFNKLQAKVGGESGNLNYLLNASDTTIDGYRDHSEAENTQLNGRFELDFSGSSRVLATLHHTDQPLANDPGALTTEEAAIDRTAARARNVAFDAGEALKQTRVGLLYENLLSDNSALEARIYHTGRDFNNKLPFEAGGAVDLDRNFAGGGINYTTEGFLVGKRNRLVAGIDFDRQDDDRRRFANMLGTLGALSFDQNERVDAVGVFMQNETALWDRGELTLGLRYDEVRFDVTDHFLSDGDDSGDVTFDQFSPMVGVAFQHSENTRLYGSISTGFETPTTTEFANPSGGGFNQTLKPQTSTNYEVGVKSRGDDYRFEAALFHIDVKDELVPYELPGQPGRTFYENAGASERDGIEVAFTRKLMRGMELTAAYTWSDFVFTQFQDENGNNFDGNRIPGIPEHLFHLSWSWFAESGLYFLWNATYTGPFFADNANEDEIDSYTVSNIKLGYTGFFGDWEVAPFLGVNNVFDQKYNGNIRINAFGKRYFEPAPERNLYLGLTIRKNFGN